MAYDLSNGIEADDGALVARARGGDREAFSALVRRHQGTVFRVCHRILGDAEDAADATQESFVRAYRKLDTFQGQSAFRTWLLRLTVNVSLNERARRHPTAQLDDERAAPGAGADTIAQAEAAAQIHQALQGLPTNHRAAVVLRDLEGLSYAEVATALAVPEGTAKGWAHRGRERLKDILNVNTDASVLELLPAYVADELGAEERARVERALADSARLRDEQARYQQLFVLLAALSLDERDAPAGLDLRIMRQITVQWYLGAAARWLEGLTGAYGRALVHYLRLG